MLALLFDFDFANLFIVVGKKKLNRTNGAAFMFYCGRYGKGFGSD